MGWHGLCFIVSGLGKARLGLGNGFVSDFKVVVDFACGGDIGKAQGMH